MTRRISLGCALGALFLFLFLGACQQTLVLDDLSPDGSLSGSGGVGPSDASSDGHCSGGQAEQISFSSDVPQVIVALDRSSTTTETPFGQQDTEFSAAAADLSAEESSYQPSGQGRDANRVAIPFSYLDFPDTAPDCYAALGCCSSDVADTSSGQLFQTAAYACSSPNACILSNDRPIAAALTTAHDTFAQNASPQTGQRFVLLVTGGAPSGGCFAPSDCQAAINEIQALKSLDVTTYIVGMGDQTNDSCLQELANAEGSQQQYYSPAMAPNDLVSALGGFTSSIAQTACRLTLSATPSSSSQLTVVYGGTTVPQSSGNGSNGWSLDTESGMPRLVLHGSACQNFVNNGPFGLQIYQGCLSGVTCPDGVT